MVERGGIMGICIGATNVARTQRGKNIAAAT